MVSVSAGSKSLAVGGSALIAVVMAMAPWRTGVAAAKEPAPAHSTLCTAGETPLFTCPLGTKRASVCGSGNRAVYRYGAPGRVELTATTLTLAKQGFSGGGETQIQITNNDYSYVLFDKTTRTGFGSGGRNDPDSRSGLLVRHAGKTIASRECDNDAPIPSRASSFIRAGGSIVPH